MKNSDRPWRVCTIEQDQIISGPLYDAARLKGLDDNDACGEALICDTGGNFQNAALIVRAVNEHAALIAVAASHKRLVESVEKFDESPKSLTDWANMRDEIWYSKEAQANLAAVRKGVK